MSPLAKERAANFARIGAAFGIGFIIGPLIAMQLFSHFIDAKRAAQVPGATFFSAAIIGPMMAVKARRVHETEA